MHPYFRLPSLRIPNVKKFSTNTEFSQWIGLAIVLLGLITVNANGLLIDSNANEISDIWEAKYEVDDPSDGEDADQDGFSDFAEGKAGTNPFDAQSNVAFKFKEVHTNAGLWSWPSKKGKEYALQRQNGQGQWIQVGATLPGHGGEVSQASPEASGQPHRVIIANPIPVIDEIRNYLSSRDLDQDGRNGFDEWTAGTSLADPNDRLTLNQAGTSDVAIFEWLGRLGFEYAIERWIEGEWVKIFEPFPGMGRKVSYTVATDLLGSLYRLASKELDSDDDGLMDWEEILAGLDRENPHSLEMTRSDGELAQQDLDLGGEISLEAVNIVLDASSNESGSIRIRRKGGLAKVTVSLTVSGSAIPGTDYVELPVSIELPFGVREHLVEIQPLLGEAIPSTKEVTIHVDSSPHFSLGETRELTVSLLKENLLNVQDFGATGNGVTDDSNALQAAIDALEASSTHNGLYFPAGTYLLRIYRPSNEKITGHRRVLKIGKTDLAGRHLVLRGEPGAKLFSRLSPFRVHILVCSGSFRSLSIHNLELEQDSRPLTATPGSEPNASNGVVIAKKDGRFIDQVSFDRCVFNNCHRSVGIYGSGYDDFGKVRIVSFESCQILNPYGANTIDSSGSFGGGQQVYLNPWVQEARYYQNTFEGGGEDMTDVTTSPGGRLKDGSHFGSPLRLYFIGNTVKRMGVEALYQKNDNTLMSGTATSFTVPAANDSDEATVEVWRNNTTWPIGETIVIRTSLIPGAAASNSVFTIRAYDPETSILTISNQGADGAAPAGSAMPSGRIIYLDEREQPTVAIIKDNLFLGEIPPGGVAFPAQKGIVIESRSIVSGNFISGYGRGISSYAETHTPRFPSARGSVIENNLVRCRNGQTYDSVYTLGMNYQHGNEVVRDNLVIAPVSYKTMGVQVNVNNALILRNQLLCDRIVRNPYSSDQWTVGIALGFLSTFTHIEGNSTSGFDNGVGPGAQFTEPSYWVYDHRSYLDAVPVSTLGILNGDDQ